MRMGPSLRLALIVLLLALLACASSACELVADFDRDKIPEPPRDAAALGDGSTSNPIPDAATDGSTPDAGDDEDAGR
jgi:hypothetical protein